MTDVYILDQEEVELRENKLIGSQIQKAGD